MHVMRIYRNFVFIVLNFLNSFGGSIETSDQSLAVSLAGFVADLLLPTLLFSVLLMFY